MANHEFRGEEPLTPVVRHWETTGVKVSREGTYVCTNCRDAANPPRTFLRSGDEFPKCPSCGPDARWERCGPDVLHCD